MITFLFDGFFVCQESVWAGVSLAFRAPAVLPYVALRYQPRMHARLPKVWKRKFSGVPAACPGWEPRLALAPHPRILAAGVLRARSRPRF